MDTCHNCHLQLFNITICSSAFSGIFYIYSVRRCTFKKTQYGLIYVLMISNINLSAVLVLIDNKFYTIIVGSFFSVLFMLYLMFISPMMISRHFMKMSIIMVCCMDFTRPQRIYYIDDNGTYWWTCRTITFL